MILTKELLHQHGACKDGIDFCERNKLFGFDLDKINDIVGDYNGCVEWLQTNILNFDIEYNSDGNIIRKWCKDSRSYVLIYEYNDNKQLIRKDDLRCITHRYEYDSNGNLTKRYSSDGYYFTYKYDKNNNKISEVDYQGNILDYDDNGNLVCKHYKSDRNYWAKFEYDNNNNKIKEYDSDGYWITYEYDERNNRIAETNSEGYSFEWGYDDHDNLITERYSDNDITLTPVEYYPDGQLKQYAKLFIPFFEKI